MDAPTLSWIASVTGARRAALGERIQSLWSGYGAIVRVELEGAQVPAVVVKRVSPGRGRHPRGWSGDRGHERKLRSYAVELAFYRRWGGRCGPRCRVPGLLGSRDDDGWIFVLEDLDAAGFGGRRGRLSEGELDGCLAWLAAFHAAFLGEEPEGLWPVGTYWHLDTRPDELAATDDARLRAAAGWLDQRLSGARFQTLVHGDAKLANFCFGPAGVAAVDFQYVGGGCGMKDLAYFLSSCLSSDELEEGGARCVDRYFELLRGELAGRDVDLDALEAEWRGLYPVAWADFSRFLAGWAPGHWKLDRFSRRITESVLAGFPGS